MRRIVDGLRKLAEEEIREKQADFLAIPASDWSAVTEAIVHNVNAWMVADRKVASYTSTYVRTYVHRYFRNGLTTVSHFSSGPRIESSSGETVEPGLFFRCCGGPVSVFDCLSTVR